MGRGWRSSVTLPLSLLLLAVLLEVTANFAANDSAHSAIGRLVQRIAGPALIVLLIFVVVGNAIVLRAQNPRSNRPRWDSDRAPYPGLSAFAESDAAVFFGRDAQIAELIRHLDVVDALDIRRLVCVVGASGSGKSSLVHAGLLPRLRSRRWYVLPTLFPAGEPLTQLAAALATATGTDRARLLRRLWSEPGSLARILAAWRASSGHRFTRVLLVIDQFEELVTLSGQAERDLFLDRIAEALATDRRLWVVATVRLEFLADLLNGPHADLFATPMTIGAIRPADLLTIVEQPAQLVDMRFDDGLSAQIVNDTATTDALPLLAYLLQELYLAAGAGKLVTTDAYQAVGGVACALAQHADTVFAELCTSQDAQTVLSTLLRLVAFEGNEPARRRVPLDELTEPQRRIIAAFTEARLVTSSATDGRADVQVAHEALFRQWAPLRQEVATHAEHLKRRSELER